MTSGWNTAQGRVVEGHGVASGRSSDPRFPGGTLAMQAPFFARRGFDLSAFWLGTLNVDIAPRRFVIGRAPFTFRSVKWHPDEPAEDFSFFECRIASAGINGVADGWIYYPHPETKPEHEQPAGVLEVLSSRLSGVCEGSRVSISIPEVQIRFHPASGIAPKAG